MLRKKKGSQALNEDGKLPSTINICIPLAVLYSFRSRIKGYTLRKCSLSTSISLKAITEEQKREHKQGQQMYRVKFSLPVDRGRRGESSCRLLTPSGSSLGVGRPVYPVKVC